MDGGVSVVGKSLILTDIPQMCSVVDFDRSIYVWLVLEEDGVLFIAGSRGWKGRMIIHNAVTCQNPVLKNHELSSNINSSKSKQVQ
jgi:hypothetical protein